MLLDKLITTFDTGLRTVFAQAVAARARPDATIEESSLNEAEKRHAAALMRINHVGEICAQALYSGQAFTSRNPHTVKSLQHAADEETDHLAWCESRINELGGRKSLLNPIWYIGSFALGATAGLMSDKWNLGFLSETEQQVSAHLNSHLSLLSEHDTKSRTIVSQMWEDEMAHAAEAKRLGGEALPQPIKAGMKIASTIMTRTAYYV